MARNYRLTLKVEERNNEARQAEQAGNLPKAIKLYEQNIKEDYADEYAFERLMIIYRKQKEYKDELRVINRGIDLFQHSMQEHLKQTLSRHIDGKKLELLSNAILKKTSSKTQQPHFPDPIDKWMKRREIVEQKLEK
jgi:tetratricopeptide (TPR) repeat protein